MTVVSDVIINMLTFQALWHLVSSSLNFSSLGISDVCSNPALVGNAHESVCPSLTLLLRFESLPIMPPHPYTNSLTRSAVVLVFPLFNHRELALAFVLFLYVEASGLLSKLNPDLTCSLLESLFTLSVEKTGRTCSVMPLVEPSVSHCCAIPRAL